MKIFLATTFESQTLFNEYRDRLSTEGHDVYDWTVHPPVRPYSENAEAVKDHASENIAAVVAADCFILVADPRSRGALVELGAAIGRAESDRAPKIFVIGEETTMYIYHPSVNYVSNIEEVIVCLRTEK